MARIMTKATALRFLLEAASQLQNDEVQTADDWSDLADDVAAVVEYANAKANELYLSEEEED